MPGVQGLLAFILGSSALFWTVDSALPGETECASIVCPVAWDKLTNTYVQLVPNLVPPTTQVLSTLMEHVSGEVTGASTWTCVYPDLDECASSPCNSHQRCIDGHRSYTCECEPGYDGPNCEIDINECWSNPCANGGTCQDRINRYTCSCLEWFGGGDCSKRDNLKTTTCPGKNRTLNCGDDHSIHIVDAKYGRKSDAYVCSVNRTMPADCFTDSLLAVKESCEGESTCILDVTDTKFGDPCGDTPKYLTMTHQCLCRYHTNDSGENHNYHWLFPVSRIENGKFKFLVRATSDAHVALSDQASLNGEYVEIDICGRNNTAAAVIDCLGCTPVITTPGSFCQNDAFTGFWITFADGLYKLGLANETVSFLQWQDPNPFDVNRVGVFSGYGSDADWMFDSACSA